MLCRKRTIAPLLLPLALLLTACATTPPATPLPTLNAAMFRCEAAPDVPTADRLAQDDGDTALAIFITRQSYAHSDCEQTLGEARTTLEIMGLTVTDTAVTAKKEEPKKRGLFGIGW